MMPMHKDKIIVDVSDSEELSEAFSRKEVGEECKFSGMATLDELEDGTAVLSIRNITFGGKPKSEEKEVEEPDEVEEPEESEAPMKSAAAKMYAESEEE